MPSTFTTAATSAAVVASTFAIAPTLTPAPEPPTMVVSAALRCQNGTLSIVDDTAHDSHGVIAVTATSTHLRITHTTMNKLGTASVTPDETYAQRNVDLGASVGLSRTDVYFTRNGTPVSPTSICYSWSNVWVAIWGYR